MYTYTYIYIHAYVHTYIHRPQKTRRSPRQVGVSGVVRGTTVYRGDYSTAIGRSDRHLYHYIQTKNTKHFE
jgi:hypothetical protein